MCFHVRLATLDDVKGIVDVYCSDVDKWFRWVSQKRVEAQYEELSIAERYDHGGPWMSVETCAIHLNNLLIAGQYPFVAELDGRIVGELELYIGEEKGKLGKTAFIDVLMVHRDYRRRGIGKALVEKAEEVARSRGCDTLSVWPEKRAILFYEKCGLAEVAYRVVHAVIDLSKSTVRGEGDDIEAFPKDYSALKSLVFISPRTMSSYAAWLKSRYKSILELSLLKTFKGFISSLGSAFIIESIWRFPREARLVLWISDERLFREALSWICGKAREFGFMKLHVLVDEELYKKHVASRFTCRVVEKEIMLVKQLKT